MKTESSQLTIRVGLTYDLRDAYLEAGYSEMETAEFDRADTIDSIESALRGLGYAVDRIGNIKQLAGRLVNGDTWDLVFNICEGMHGMAVRPRCRHYSMPTRYLTYFRIRWCAH